MGKESRLRKFIEKNQDLMMLCLMGPVMLSCIKYLAPTGCTCTAEPGGPSGKDETVIATPTKHTSPLELPATATPEFSLNGSVLKEPTIAPEPEQKAPPCIPVIVWPTGLFDITQQKLVVEWAGNVHSSLGDIQDLLKKSCNDGSFPVGNLCGERLEIGMERFDLSNRGTFPNVMVAITPTEAKGNCGDAVAAWEVWNNLQREELVLPEELHGISINDPMIGFHWLEGKLGQEAVWTIFNPEHFGLSFHREGKTPRMVDSSLYFQTIYCSNAKTPTFSVPVSGIISRMIREMKLGEYQNLPKNEDDYGWFVSKHFRNVVGDKVYSFLLNTAFHSPRFTSGVGAVARQILRRLLEELPQEHQDILKMGLGSVYCASSLGERPYRENKLLKEILAADTSTWVESYGYYTSFFARRVARNTISPPTLPDEEINARLLVVSEMHHQVALAIEEAGEIPPRCIAGEVVTINSSSVEMHTATPFPSEQEETSPETKDLPKTPNVQPDTNPEN